MAANGADRAVGGGGERVPTGARTWLDPAWRAVVLDWAGGELAALGRPVTGPVEQPHVRPWSTAFRIPTTRGVVWLKATGPGSAYEGPLLQAFARLGVRRVVVPLAVHPDRPLFLVDDGGPTLRSSRPDVDGDRDLTAWARILPEYATLQRSTETHIAELRAAGVPDGRPGHLPDELERLLDDEQVWNQVPLGERAVALETRRRLRAEGPAFLTATVELASSGIPAAIQHDDLHGNNVLVGPDGDRFFDWGDAVVAHPFGTLAATFRSIASKAGLDRADRAFDRLRDAYLEAWTDLFPRPALDEVAGLAVDLGAFARASSWERALQGLEVGEMGGFEGSTAAWLGELATALDRRSAR